LKMAVTVPASIAVQRKIADFLRTETTRIDALIARKRHLSSLLNERTEAHVSGLMVDAASRFGERPLKAAAELRISNVDKRSYEGQVKVRLCNYTDVYYHREIDSSIEFMIATADPAQVRRLSLRAGDVLITKDSETADDIAVPSLVVETVPELVLGYHLALLRPIDVDGSFLYWAIRSRRCRDEFSLAASGVTRMGLRQDAMGRVRIPAAPLSAQRKIVNQAESVVRKSEQLCRHLGVQIALLREHRQALITAAVTGDLEIPEVAR
jgi:type I restriction enzyme, S subunit